MRNAKCLIGGCAGLVLAVALCGPAAAGTALDAPGLAKATNCSACHGFAGNSRSDTMPILAGMWPEYLKKSIEDYAAGKRPSTEMEPYAKQVVALGVDDVAAYFASQRRESMTIVADPARIARGRAASAQCVICHGQGGKGDRAKLIPDLTGQPPGYLLNQMLLFKQDKRSPGDTTLKALKELMKTIPDETLADLAAYYSSLR